MDRYCEPSRRKAPSTHPYSIKKAERGRERISADGSTFSLRQSSAGLLRFLLDGGSGVTNKNRIMIHGPQDDGTYVVEFRTAEGDVLAISIPSTEMTVQHDRSSASRGFREPRRRHAAGRLRCHRR
jgi:hypothetical protein